MQLAKLVELYESLSRTSRRTESRRLLGEFLRTVEAGEIDRIVYLSQGMLRPEFEGVELGVATALARRAVAGVTGATEAEIDERLRLRGDLGTVTEELLALPRSAPTSTELSVEEVYRGLRSIADTRGEGSQEQKVAVVKALLSRATPTEAKYLVRLVLGELRLGIKDQTLLDALALAFSDGGATAREEIEKAYNLSSDLGETAARLAVGGLDRLKEVEIRVGRPIRPMLAERERSLSAVLERMGGVAALEYKYDGLRVQAHVAADGEVRLFSRRLEEIGAQFPDVTRALPSAVPGPPSILEGECVPVDPETDEIRPFQEVSRRRGRKHDLERLQQEVPVCLFLFDVLLSGGVAFYGRPFPERRQELARILRPNSGVRLATQKVVRSVDEAQSFFDEAIGAGAEGVMAKSVASESSYRAGARGFWWIKYKREYTQSLSDSIDGVVVGGFHGRGRRAGTYGAYLLAVYDTEETCFESFTKVGTGFDDAALDAIARRVAPHRVPEPPPDVRTGLVPDAWFRPTIVLEVRGAELTLSPIHRAALGRIRGGAGLALRFPRFTGRIREDKDPTDSTTAQELVEMYRHQVRKLRPEGGAEPGP